MQVVDIYQYLFHCVLCDRDTEGQYWNRDSHMVASCIWKILASDILSHSFEVDFVVPLISLCYFRHRKLWTISIEFKVSISGHYYYINFVSAINLYFVCWCMLQAVQQNMTIERNGSACWVHWRDTLVCQKIVMHLCLATR